ncbi:MAG: response regulator [Cyanobacteria bacterium RI_101]|nr:response regulator [Cyanobacteria bacterium RI_101]
MFPETLIEFLQKKLCHQGAPPLSWQEEMILQGIMRQETYEQIANSLYISAGTARNIASRLFRRLSALFGYKLTKKNCLSFLKTVVNNSDYQLLENYEIPVKEIEKDPPILLLIDDQLDNLLLLKNILTQANYLVRTCKSGRVALEFIDQIKPDLILLDLLMPDLDGYQVCGALKQHPQYRDTPIIFLSAVSDLIDKVKAFKLGACDYITKPFEAVEVLARVSSQLALQAQRRALAEEIQARQSAIAALTQSHSILASVLNTMPYGVAALSALRNCDDAEVIDFRFILVNPIFSEFFQKSGAELQNYPSCASLFAEKGLTCFTRLIQVVTLGQNFEEDTTLKNRLVRLQGLKLGDGAVLNLYPR